MKDIKHYDKILDNLETCIGTLTPLAQEYQKNSYLHPSNMVAVWKVLLFLVEALALLTHQSRKQYINSCKTNRETI